MFCQTGKLESLTIEERESEVFVSHPHSVRGYIGSLPVHEASNESCCKKMAKSKDPRFVRPKREETDKDRIRTCAAEAM